MQTNNIITVNTSIFPKNTLKKKNTTPNTTRYSNIFIFCAIYPIDSIQHLNIVKNVLRRPLECFIPTVERRRPASRERAGDCPPVTGYPPRKNLKFAPISARFPALPLSRADEPLLLDHHLLRQGTYVQWKREYFPSIGDFTPILAFLKTEAKA